jgi:hypothetical protein
LYRVAVAAHPGSEELARRLRDAERRRELDERRALYEQVLAKDHGDRATQEKLLAVLVALNEGETVRQLIGQMLKGREQAPEALIGVALAWIPTLAQRPNTMPAGARKGAQPAGAC